MYMHGNKDCAWPRGVTVSTLDSESSDRGSNPREASFVFVPLRARASCACSRGFRPRRVAAGPFHVRGDAAGTVANLLANGD